MEKYLYNCTSEETAHTVDNYPWGFRLRTKQRYWIESSEKKNGGQRLVTQTMNPKNSRWCKPKKSTYKKVMILGIDGNGHVKTESVDIYGMGKDWESRISDFISKHKENLTDFQKKQIRGLIAQNKVMKNITVEFMPVGLETEEDRYRRIKERKKAENNIINAVNYEYAKNDPFA